MSIVKADAKPSPRVAIIGGGLAGLAAAAALGESGFDVDVYEARAFFGGRASSYPVPGSETGEVIDNCQHILLRCCDNLLDFYRRLGVENKVQFHKKFYFIEPGGQQSTMQSGLLAPPFHFSGSFATLKFLNLSEKIAVGKAMLAIRSERLARKDLDRITMLEWLKEKKQPQRAIDRFWRQILVSAINEELDIMAAAHGFQVFWLGFLAGKHKYEMGIPSVPLGDLYNAESWKRIPKVHLIQRCPIERIGSSAKHITGIYGREKVRIADYYISALPFEKLESLHPPVKVDFKAFSHSPITGIHLWFDKPVTDLPHATLLDRTIQWFFNKGDGRYLMLVVSASRSLAETPKQQVIDLALRELAEFLPQVKDAKVTKAHVVKEIRATFSARTGLESKRPDAKTEVDNFFLAGDWTRSGWPATMEGAVRSGYLAAEAVCHAAGSDKSFVIG